ncbi:MAG: acyl-CoA dehydrogenase [Halobacteriovoraceae bacterium]|nr:acyl-CoA dehydrogenase [Halobacteriovoraceae bacterium]|tara:strand:+ start:4493 stop:5659 length:1167 start_codon:yes stop_codon:yes gene_type:complete
MAKYESLNYIDIESEYTAEQKGIRDSVRQFVDTDVLPTLQQAFRDEKFPDHLIPKIGSLGLLGANLKGYGCAGIDTVSYGLVMQEIERADSGLRSFVSVQGALCMWPIYTYGSEAQKEKYLPKMATGEMIGCFGLTEPDYGSNPGGMITTAKKTDKGYVLNGNKMWITNGLIADLAVVWAKLDGKVRGFIVDKGTPGFTVSEMKGKFSLRVSPTAELHFENCEIPAENILPDIEGLKGPLSCLNQARFGIAWGVVGAANACYDAALNYSLERQIFSKPLAGYQLAQAKLAKMVQGISMAQALLLHLSKLKEQGKLGHHMVSLAKMNNCRMALDCARDARDMLGANGIIDEYPVIRHMLNLETVNTYEGTEDIHRLVIGRQVTGLAAFE